MTFDPTDAMTRHPTAWDAEPAGARNAPVAAPRAPRPADAHEPDALLAGVRHAIGAGDLDQARRSLAMLVDRTDGYRHWLTGAQLAARIAGRGSGRTAKVAVLGSYTISPQPQFLQLAGLRFGLDLDVYEAPYGQYRQEILDVDSQQHRFAPDAVIIAVHAGDLSLPWHTGDPSGAVAAELARWTGLWRCLRERDRALILQHNLVTPAERPLGHLSTRLPGSRPRLIQALNERLADAAGPGVVILDCEWLSGLIGKRVWCDDGQWHIA
ncbi:MAG TPA: hypothetical protein VK891_17785, partial [Euzebyales bacterium]|nr:hypothetical protein [Euzebyales bacterium]